MIERTRESIEKSLANYESKITTGVSFSKSEVDKLRVKVRALMYNFPEEEKEQIESRINTIVGYAKEDERFISNVSPRNCKIKSGILASIRSKNKLIVSNFSKAAQAAGCAIFLGAMVVHSTGCGDITQAAQTVETSSESLDTEQPTEVVETTEVAEEKVEFTEMDEEYVKLSEDIVVAMNDQIFKGLEVNEDNKDLMAKKYTEYYLLNRMDELTDTEWANIFQNSTITASDLMNAKFDFEWIDEQRVTVSDKYLDYSMMFNESDAKLLNDATMIIDKVKSSDKNTKEEGIKEFKEYVNTNLALNNGRMQYSERALDTFRAVYFDAFDELTNHKEIDDELEHAINTTITCSIANNDLNVEDATIQSLQSDFETYEKEKLELRFQNGWDYVLNNEVNPYNDIEYVVNYVSDHIDLTLYNELPNYEETLTNMFLDNTAGKHKNDSGISDGNGGIIDKSELERTNTTDKESYEQAITQEVEQQSNDSVQIKDNNGNVVDNEQQLIDDATQGYLDGNQGKPKDENASDAYNDAYEQGAADKEKVDSESENSTTEEFQPVENGETKVEESTENIEDYTQNENIEENQNTEEPVTEFVPIGEETNDVPTETTTDESNEEYYDFTEGTGVDTPITEEPVTEFVPIEEETNDVPTEITTESVVEVQNFTDEPITNETTVTEEPQQEITETASIDETQVSESTKTANSEVSNKQTTENIEVASDMKKAELSNDNEEVNAEENLNYSEEVSLNEQATLDELYALRDALMSEYQLDDTSQKVK